MLIKGYFFYYSEKQFLLKKITLLFSCTALMIVLINGFSFGVFSLTYDSIINGYGDIYIQLKKKLSKKAFLKKNIKNILMTNSNISSLDIYGIINGLLISGNRHVPVYLLSYLEVSPQLFFDKNSLPNNKNTFYCGEVLFKKYNSLEKKKLAIITHEDKKHKSLLFDAMPISFYNGYNFGWDDWNERAILIPIENIENYFEISTVEFIHVHIKNKEKINDVLLWIKEKLNSEINYIELGVKVLPEYNKCLILLNIISYSISFLIIIFSFFLLLVLIDLYLYQNKNEFYYLIIIGIRNLYIQLSLIIFFLLLGLCSLFIGFLLGYAIILILNFFRCIVISVELNSYFFCVINWNALYYHLIGYMGMLLLSVCFFYKKYSIK